MMDGDARGNTLPAKPREVAKPSAHPFFGSWQDAQDIVPLLDKRTSKNSLSPSATRCGVGSLPVGNGTGGKRQRNSSAVGASDGVPAIEPSATAPRSSGSNSNPFCDMVINTFRSAAIVRR